MVSGFTDDRQVRDGGRAKFADNWELSAQRALTVMRALIDDGLPSSAVFAAAFGAEQPVASNADAAGPRAEPARRDGAHRRRGPVARRDLRAGPTESPP
jgi:flagellar motor protein MotB